MVSTRSSPSSFSSSFSSSPDLDSPSPFPPRNPWSPRTDHDANGQTPSSPLTNGHTPSPTPPSTSNPTSPAPLTLRAFLLGLTLGASLLLTLHLALLSTNHTPLWRLPFFLSALSLFHYLEYQTTALYNPPSATVSAFLLSQNGRAYNIAHTLAFTESAIRWYFFPDAHIFRGSQRLRVGGLGVGFAMMGMGQVVRTTAMAQAGRNFSHVISMKKKEGHVLVTDGVYRWLRHPSYFGFFWWGLGSQIVLGNIFCLVGYAVVLWRFFRLRIEKEENSLIGFFGMDYVRYRDRTRIGIPFV